MAILSDNEIAELQDNILASMNRALRELNFIKRLLDEYDIDASSIKNNIAQAEGLKKELLHKIEVHNEEQEES